MIPPRIDLKWSGLPTAGVAAQRLAAELTITVTTADLLIRRGLTSGAAARAFVFPTEAQSHNPNTMKGMPAVRDRVRAAVLHKERIVIFGDYDADGIPGTALLYIWLSKAGGNVKYFIPNREDGYGLSLTAAKRLIAAYQPQVVITVDCGSSDHEAVNWLRSQNVDVVVTDHHLTLKGAPPTPYFLNPSRSDGETYPFRFLCGCGVAYKLIQALSSKRHETGLYDLLAISTVGDQVSLTGENRFYVKTALKALNTNAQGNVGLRALVRASGGRLENLGAIDLGWKVCPRINAVGRMGANPNMVVELLSTSDPNRAAELAREMTRLNSARQGLTEKLFEQALAQVGNNPDDIIVVNLPEATVGVAGLVAAKVVESYGRPVLVVNSEGRGSGRAPAGLEIIGYMKELQAMGVFGVARKNAAGETVTPDFGGHAGACGFHNVIVRDLIAGAKRLRLPKDRVGVVAVEAVIPLSALTTQFCAEVDSLEPFGVGNPDPAIAILNVAITEQSASKDGRHLFLAVSDGTTARRVVWFGAGAYAGNLPARMDILGRPTVSVYSGNTPEMVLCSMRKPRASPVRQ